MDQPVAVRSSLSYSSVNDISLPQSEILNLSVTELLPTGLKKRSNSDSAINPCILPSLSMLTVNCRECVLGNGHCSSVIVSWDIKEDVGTKDWIGLFATGMLNMFTFACFCLTAFTCIWLLVCSF